MTDAVASIDPDPDIGVIVSAAGERGRCGNRQGELATGLPSLRRHGGGDGRRCVGVGGEEARRGSSCEGVGRRRGRHLGI